MFFDGNVFIFPVFYHVWVYICIWDVFLKRVIVSGQKTERIEKFDAAKKKLGELLQENPNPGVFALASIGFA